MKDPRFSQYDIDMARVVTLGTVDCICDGSEMCLFHYGVAQAIHNARQEGINSCLEAAKKLTRLP